jgi:magnesium-transporting ATPase (P-type)
MSSHGFADSVIGAGIASAVGIHVEEKESGLDVLRHSDPARVIAASRQVSRLDTKSKHFSECHLFTVAEELHTDVLRGLTTAEAKKRLAANGPNQLEQDSHPSILVLFLQQFSNVIILLLLAACIASFALGEVRAFA